VSGNTRTFWVNPNPNLRHGTGYAYYRKGCRCDDCLGAWRAMHARRKRANPDYLARRRQATQRWRQRQLAERIAEATR
jgi:hypothetical protein